MLLNIMKITFNTFSKNFTVKFHDLHLYNDDGYYQYLFFIPGFSIQKKYLLDFDFNEFKNFIKECMEIKYPNSFSKFDFETQIIQLIESYKIFPNFSNQIMINKKIGNLLLNNIDFIKFDYLKNLYKNFNSIAHTNVLSEEYIKNSQYKYLIIIMNNLVEVKSSNIYFENNQHSSLDLLKINYLDFIYDYYLDD